MTKISTLLYTKCGTTINFACGGFQFGHCIRFLYMYLEWVSEFGSCMCLGLFDAIITMCASVYLQCSATKREKKCALTSDWWWIFWWIVAYFVQLISLFTVAGDFFSSLHLYSSSLAIVFCHTDKSACQIFFSAAEKSGKGGFSMTWNFNFKCF